MRLLLACAVCAALVAVDVLARGVRLRCLLRGAGHRLRLPALCESILFGDAAAATTPMRLGGEPARWLGLMGGGVPAGVGAAVLALEMATYLSIVALSGAAAAWTLGGAWWAGVGPRLAARAGDVLPWAATVLVASVAVWTWVRRRGRSASTRPEFAAVRGVLGWPLAAAVPLTLVSIAARLGMLPVLAQTLPEPPPMGVLVLGSFALVYGQLFFPTPGGAGAVELLAAAGTAGELGGSGGAVFLAWRAVTTGLPVVLGYGLALRRYGRAAVRGVLRGQRPADVTPSPNAVEPA
ncbi:lysylphosphatidylglycerol synthase transmembrane domain-containing protein [Longimicrobium sp.]|uniref:lysylphosphatidylglycerol synthase transmembrane domain-containing protein n=1 Tax=Longimicrobium sp. TaxID=2029185 RepID=UPI002E356FAB|nr:lysylphosphatidylglycerol synthase transmembrane domain-containing protein [Longimicrobium sp.]HEX6039642.1 lysylphosphatidylglycerol synthase transmembrane domain-containing protein [Longimicrobium sp.]